MAALEKLAVILAVASVAVALIFLSSFAHRRRPIQNLKDRETAHSGMRILALQEPDWKSLRASVENYSLECHNALLKLSRQLEIALNDEVVRVKTNRCSESRLSEMIRQRINRLSDLYEKQQELLKKLLIPVPVTQCLSSQPHNVALGHPEQAETGDQQALRFSTTHFPYNQLPWYQNNYDTSVYNSATQVLIHLVRDWTSEGAMVRNALYPWCVRQVEAHVAAGGTVLVPGSGLGRLAWELARANEHRVESVEQSLAMTVTAARLLYDGFRGTCHPFVLDYFCNEIDSKLRYDAVPFPDVDVAATPPLRGSLVHVIGDVTMALSDETRRASLDGVVSCFFLDTSGNVYETVRLMHRALQIGGVWINAGPLQWHPNAELTPSADELREMLVGQGFSVLTWKIDSEPIAYRSMNAKRSTHFEGYRPLRFVARKQS